MDLNASGFGAKQQRIRQLLEKNSTRITPRRRNSEKLVDSLVDELSTVLARAAMRKTMGLFKKVRQATRVIPAVVEMIDAWADVRQDLDWLKVELGKAARGEQDLVITASDPRATRLHDFIADANGALRKLRDVI